jgi:hypothetical protein
MNEIKNHKLKDFLISNIIQQVKFISYYYFILRPVHGQTYFYDFL